MLYCLQICMQYNNSLCSPNGPHCTISTSSIIRFIQELLAIECSVRHTPYTVHCTLYTNVTYVIIQ